MRADAGRVVRMRAAVFNRNIDERAPLDVLNAGRRHDLTCFNAALGADTAFLAAGFSAVGVFVIDVDRVSMMVKGRVEPIGGHWAEAHWRAWKRR
jgi:hypothetical protein